MELAVFRKAFDCEDFCPVSLHCEHCAGLHASAIQQDGARATISRVAADVRPGEIEFLAKKFYQQGTRLDGE